MGNKLRRIFSPTLEERKEDLRKYRKLYNELKQDKECSTCKHCVRVADYPAFVIAEECECKVGLQCDTVLFTVKDCEKWEGENMTLEYLEQETLDNAIKYLEQKIEEFEKLKKIKAVTYEDYDRIGKVKQLVKWLKELKTLKEQKFNVHNIEPEDEDYPLAMRVGPFAEKYTLMSIDGLVVVPLFQVIDAISSVKANIVRRNGIDYCPTCGKPINAPTIIESEDES